MSAFFVNSVLKIQCQWFSWVFTCLWALRRKSSSYAALKSKIHSYRLLFRRFCPLVNYPVMNYLMVPMRIQPIAQSSSNVFTTGSSLSHVHLDWNSTPPRDTAIGLKTSTVLKKFSNHDAEYKIK